MFIDEFVECCGFFSLFRYLILFGDAIVVCSRSLGFNLDAKQVVVNMTMEVIPDQKEEER